MGAKTLLILKPHLDWITTSSVNDFYENMLWILSTLWVFVCNFLLCSVRLLVRHISSIQVSDGEREYTVVKPHEDFQLQTNNSEDESIEEKEDDDGDEDYGNIKGEQVRKDFNLLESSSAARANKCQFTSSKGISRLIEEPTCMRFSFQEFYVGQNVANICDHRNFITGAVEEKDIPKIGLEEAAGDHVQEYDSDQLQTTLNEEFVSVVVGSDVESSLQHTSSDSGDLGSKGNSLDSEESISGEDNPFETEAIVLVDSSLASDANSGSSYPIPFTQGSSDEVDNSNEYEFQSDQIGVAEELGSEEEVPWCETIIPDIKYQNFHDDDDECVAYEPVVLDARMKGKHNVPDRPDLYRVVSSDTEDIEEQENPVPDKDSFKPNFDEKGESEDEWEHEDILEQLKLELRNARTGGLPTILEEENEGEQTESSSETPAQVVEVLNTLRTNQKTVYKDRVSEFQKFYTSYAETMQKLDVLNYQTMHAIGLLPFKDPVKIISIRKAVAPISKSLVSHNIWPRKALKNTEDPILKFVGELHRDLELVYVGQVCLSWEILRWQYEKVCELKEHDSQGYCHRYNQVAGEFQLFQVLLQRFIENQPFQGPRIQNYVKNRCVIRSLLQVPAVEDDNVDDKNMQSGDDQEDAISTERLREIIEESMHIFWNFLRADKVTQRNALTNLSDPTLSDIFIGLRTSLQKKERRLKDITRSGNCIVKKFQKQRKGHHDHAQLLAQVQLRLISRVLNMPKLTKDQLIWCREKLEQTSISSKKIHVEASFLLFPC